MSKVIPYYQIDQKSNVSTNTMLSAQEALVRALDLIDFYRVLHSQNEDSVMPKDHIDWIELKPLVRD